MNNQKLYNKTIPFLGMVLIMTIITIVPKKCFGQQKLFNDITAGIGFNATSEYRYPRIGLSTDIFVRMVVYKKIGLTLNYHKVKIQKFLFGAYPNHWLDYGTTDTYAQEFIGRSTSYFGGTKSTSFVINASTIDLNIDYKFGKRNKIIPSFGFTAGFVSEANLSLRGISSSNGIILTASSESKFQKNFVYGANLSLTDEFPLNRNTSGFFRLKMILANPRSTSNEFNVSTAKGVRLYESVNFGIGIIKKIKTKNKKVNT